VVDVVDGVSVGDGDDDDGDRDGAAVAAAGGGSGGVGAYDNNDNDDDDDFQTLMWRHGRQQVFSLIRISYNRLFSTNITVVTMRCLSLLPYLAINKYRKTFI